LLEVLARKVTGSFGNSWKFRLAKLLEVPAIAGSSDSQSCWKFRQLLKVLAAKLPEVPQMLEVLAPFASKPRGLLCEQCFSVEPEVLVICARSSGSDLNGWISLWV
jgi:hypothetical protein